MNAIAKSITREKAFVEWPTLGLNLAMWAGFLALTYFHSQLPWWVIAPVGAVLVALHGSLTHEALHGHPTRVGLLNEALVFVPISLWFPYRRYKQLHLTHHRNDFLTDPAEDPESYYMDPQAWEGCPKLLRLIYTANNSMLGRFLLGPGLSVLRFWRDEFVQILRGDRAIAQAWGLHFIGIGLLYAWVSGVCGMHFAAFVFGIAYWGNSISMMRSYAEHRAHDEVGCRTIVVESGPFMSLLYMNNNLHMAHHEAPPLAWYKLPAYYRAHRERLLTENCAYLMKGYGEIARQWLLTPKEPVAHPKMESLQPLRNPAARH
jgi:fatty acid desaturase